MRILWLKNELLHPVDKGGKIRTYQMLKQLKREHRLTYLTLDDGASLPDARERADEYCDELIRVPYNLTKKFSARFYAELALNMASRVPYAIKKNESAEMRRRITEMVGQGSVDLLVCDFLAPSINVPRSLGCPTLLFQHNVESMIWLRYYETETNKAKKSYFYSQWRKMYSYEREACSRFDAVAAVSSNDRDQMRQEFAVANVYDVPTGVDTEYFHPLGGEPDAAGLVFTGSMDWMPNEDSIIYFAEQILPIIESSVPDVKLTVVGRDPTRRLLSLAQANPRIRVTGRVEDVRPFIGAAAAYVVPLRVGGGTRIKIYEAMAMAKPVISTAIGAEGLPVRDGKEIFLADTPGDFAQKVIRVLRDRSLAKRVGEQARALVSERFGWGAAVDEFLNVCEHAVAVKPQAIKTGRATAA